MHMTCDVCRKYKEISGFGDYKNRTVHICKTCFEKQMILAGVSEGSGHIFSVNSGKEYGGRTDPDLKNGPSFV